MNATLLAICSFVFMFAGAILGMLIQRFLPEHHSSSASKDAVKLGAGLIATMAALTLGLLVGSSKSTFDTVNSSVMQLGAKTIYLDRLLSNYGPEASAARTELRQSVVNGLHLIWPEEVLDGPLAPQPAVGMSSLELVGKSIRQLKSTDASQSYLRTEALAANEAILQARWLLVEQRRNALPTALFVLPLLWLSLLNGIYGLFAPRNHTVVAVLLACALSVSGALFLVLEMTTPLEGTIKVSSFPLRQALNDIGN